MSAYVIISKMKYGVISDIHSNLEALNAVLERIKVADKIICSGDLVGYGPDPNECVATVKERNILTVAGNHDKITTGEMDISWFNRDAADAIKWTQGEIKQTNLEYLKSLPLSLDLEGFQIVHGSLREPLEEYITSIFEAMPTFELMKEPLLFVGHSHVPLCIVMKNDGTFDGWVLGDGDIVKLKEFKKVIINPGGVGQPRDGDPRASYGIYDSDKNEFSLFRVPYNIEKVQEKMKKAGLPVSLIERLASGR
ncbi:MAG: metallophosphoesterase family protein [Candidatus Saganbacteria bacterium]|nr:metallophosphoesterase family protein [Candidatus Saganbacteria bacterium]